MLLPLNDLAEMLREARVVILLTEAHPDGRSQWSSCCSSWWTGANPCWRADRPMARNPTCTMSLIQGISRRRYMGLE